MSFIKTRLLTLVFAISRLGNGVAMDTTSNQFIDYQLEDQRNFSSFVEELLLLKNLSRNPRIRVMQKNKNKKYNRTEFKYDSVITTLAAGLESRNYDKGYWKKRELNWPRGGEGQYYKKNPIVYTQFNTSESAPLIIIFGSSYSTWRRGTWTNKLVALTKEILGNQVNFLAFPGLLTSEFLGYEAEAPDLTGSRVAHDLRKRLINYVEEIQPSSSGNIDLNKVYLVGYSGGGSLALAMAGIDGHQDQDYKLITGGVLSFSPILDVRNSFRVLDYGRKWALEQGLPSGKGLTTVGSLIEGLFKPLSYKYILQYTSRGSLESNRFIISSKLSEKDKIKQMFYNEFSIVDTKTTANSSQGDTYVWKSDKAYWSYHQDFYENYAFNKQKKLGWIPKDARLDDIVDTTKLHSEISVPTHIVFAKDDPVLSLAPEDLQVPKVIEDKLKSLQENSSIKLFAPYRGGHMGYFLDTKWLEGFLRANIN